MKIFVSISSSNNNSCKHIFETVKNTIASVENINYRVSELECNESIISKIQMSDLILIIFDETYRQQIDDNINTSIRRDYQAIIESGKPIVPIVKTNSDRNYFPIDLIYHDCITAAGAKRFPIFLESLNNGTWIPKAPKTYTQKVKLSLEEREALKIERVGKREEYQKNREETRHRVREREFREKERIKKMEIDLEKIQREHTVELQKKVVEGERVKKVINQQKTELEYLENECLVLKNKIELGDDDYDAIECCVCLVKPKNTVLVPCGHQCACYECGIQLTRCPICRTKFNKVQKIFVC
jgi:hypothetical protein